MHVRVYGVQPDEMPTYDAAVEKYGFTFEFEKTPLSAATAGEVKGCEALIILTNSRVDEECAKILSANGVKYIACRSAGSDHVDYNAIVKYGMQCCHVPAYAPEAISEHTVMLALQMLRHAKLAAKKVAVGDFTMAGLKGRQIGKLTMGVLGTGRIGRVTMSILKGFGAEILGWDPFPNPAAAALCTYVTKEELFAKSDIVFLHCPLTDDSYHTINDESLALMKDGAVLINTARGGLVDLAAVQRALDSGKLSGFGFDVHETEELYVRKKVDLAAMDEPVFKDLIARDNVIYSPHVAFYTDAAIISMIEVSLDNLKEYETTGKCRNECSAQGF